MQEVKSHEQSIISFRQITNSQLSRTHVFRVGISHVITSITAQPATIFFVLFSLVLGSAIAFIVPPLRGPDEIAHFVRIYSYVHGELLPSAELDGRKGTFGKRELPKANPPGHCSDPAVLVPNPHHGLRRRDTQQ